MKLPWTCEKCGTRNYYHGPCSCPDGRLKMVAAERATIKQRLEVLDIIERDASAALTLVPRPNQGRETCAHLSTFSSGCTPGVTRCDKCGAMFGLEMALREAAPPAYQE